MAKFVYLETIFLHEVFKRKEINFEIDTYILNLLDLLNEEQNEFLGRQRYQVKKL